MIDKLGRKIDHLRISLTDRCNLNCFYCHKEGNSFNVSNENNFINTKNKSKSNKLTNEMNIHEIGNILNTAKKAGVKTIKFTGGEPLLRKDIVEIIKLTNTIGFDHIGLSTNGTLLNRYGPKLKNAGLKNINIGCDSLTGILPKNIELLTENILNAKKLGFNIKLNCVVLNSINDHQINDMINFCIDNEINLQLIELIKLNKTNEEIYQKYYYSLSEIETKLKAKADLIKTRSMQNRSQYYFGTTFIELVIPDQAFCKNCNKIRITADGQVLPCLMKNTELINFNPHDSLKQACIMRDKYGYD